MSTSIIDGVKSPGDIKKSNLPVINLKHFALSRMNFIGLGYLHETCHKLPPLDDLGVPNKPASPSGSSHCRPAPDMDWVVLAVDSVEGPLNIEQADPLAFDFKHSPAQHLPPLLESPVNESLHAERASTSAGRFHLRIVELEARAFERVHEVHFNAIQVQKAGLVDKNFEPVRVVRLVQHARVVRSEERRVGKECRSRWSP